MESLAGAAEAFSGSSKEFEKCKEGWAHLYLSTSTLILACYSVRYNYHNFIYTDVTACIVNPSNYPYVSVFSNCSSQLHLLGGMLASNQLGFCETEICAVTSRYILQGFQ